MTSSLVVLLSTFFFASTALAQQDACLKKAEFSERVIEGIETQLSSIDAQVAASFAGSKGPAAQVQASALESEVQGFAPFIQAAQSEAESCIAKCEEKPEACGTVKMKTVAMSIKFSQMQTQLTQTRAVAAASSNIQVAGDVTVMGFAKHEKTGHVTQRAVLVPGSTPSLPGYLRELGGQGLPLGYKFTGQTQ